GTCSVRLHTRARPCARKETGQQRCFMRPARKANRAAAPGEAAGPADAERTKKHAPCGEEARTRRALAAFFGTSYPAFAGPACADAGLGCRPCSARSPAVTRSAFSLGTMREP